jgi:hypothetical protein
MSAPGEWATGLEAIAGAPVAPSLAPRMPTDGGERPSFGVGAERVSSGVVDGHDDHVRGITS